MRGIDHYYPYLTDEEKKAWRSLPDQLHNQEFGAGVFLRTQGHLAPALGHTGRRDGMEFQIP